MCMQAYTVEPLSVKGPSVNGTTSLQGTLYIHMYV